MMIKKIIKWNLAFILLYALSSTLVYFISQDTPETIPIIILTCLIFNGLITIWILATHINQMPEHSKKQKGGENHEKRITDEAVTDTKPTDDVGTADNIY